MKKNLKVLLLEDNPSDAVLILRELKKSWEKVEYTRVFSAKDMKENLFAKDWDIIISDYSMPQFTGVDGLSILKQSGLDIPFIMVSGTMGENVAVSVMKAGAGNYILKDKLHRLVQAVVRELSDKAIRLEHKRTSRALDESLAISQAVIDGSPLGISVRDKYGSLILYNEAWVRIWGYSPKEIQRDIKIKKKLIFDSNDHYLNNHLSEVRKVYEEGKELYLPELRITSRKSTSAEWISQHFYALNDEQGNVQKIVVLTEDITTRKNNEKRQNLTRSILHILNKKGSWQDIIHNILLELQKTLELECIGIRLAEGDDFPYKGTVGFTDAFVNAERSLLPQIYNNDDLGKKKIIYDCLCGKVINELLDPRKSYITDSGSFWTNDLTSLMNYSEFKDDKIFTRYRCITEGFNSLAIIPLKAGNMILGLLQINDHHMNVFTPELITYFEEIASTIAIAFQRLLADEKVVSSEKKFRSVLENSVTGIYRITIDKKILLINPFLLDMLGYSSMEELQSEEKDSTGSAGEFFKLNKRLLKFIKNQPQLIKNLDASWVTPEGNLVYARITARGILDEEGNIQYIDGTVENRTDRVKAKQELSESKEMYRSLVEKANVGIVTDDIDGKITYFNSKFASLFGYNVDEMKHLEYKDIFHPDYMAEMLEYHQNRIKGKKSPLRYELKGIKKDSTEIDLEIAVDHILDEDFMIKGTRAFLWDVTKRKQANRIQTALYNISQAISSSVNLNQLYHKIKEYLGTIIDTTNIFVALYDKEQDELSLPFEVDEKDKFDKFPAGNSLSAYIIKQGKPMMFSEDDVYALAKDKKIDILGTTSKQFLGVPLKSGETTIGILVVQSYDNPSLYTDDDLQVLSIISSEIANAIVKKRAEDNLVATNNELVKLHKSLEKKVEIAVENSRKKDIIIMQQSNQIAVGKTLSDIAHHWRQPLNALSVTFDSVAEAFEFNELTQDYLDEKMDIIHEILNKLSKSIDEFRFFHQSDSNYTEFSIKEAIMKTLYTQKAKFDLSKIRLITNLDESARITGPQNDFTQAILNVLTNAFEIFEERFIPDPVIEINLNKIDKIFRISIQDNGGGVDSEMKDDLFSLYTTTKKQLNNTGVGLYLAKLIIENKMGGKIYFHNNNAGAEFIIELNQETEIPESI